MFNLVDKRADKEVEAVGLPAEWFIGIAEEIDRNPLPPIPSVKCSLSLGDAIDRLSILHIKITRLDAAKIKPYVLQMVQYNEVVSREKLPASCDYTKLLGYFIKVNSALWDLETAARKTDDLTELGKIYREVQRVNNIRSALRLRVDEAVNSQYSDNNQYFNGARQREDAATDSRTSD